MSTTLCHEQQTCGEGDRASLPTMNMMKSGVLPGFEGDAVTGRRV
jgi:hypothetical protein